MNYFFTATIFLSLSISAQDKMENLGGEDARGASSPVRIAIEAIKAKEADYSRELEMVKQSLAKVSGDYEALEEAKFHLEDKQKAAQKAIQELENQLIPKLGNRNSKVGFNEDGFQ